MGTYYTQHQTKADMIAELTRSSNFQNNSGVNFTRTCLGYSLNGNTLFSVHELVGSNGTRQRFLTIDRLSQSDKRWGYKSFDEDSLPFYYGCPGRLIAMLDEPATENAKKWREANAIYNRMRSDYAKPGAYVIIDGVTYERTKQGLWWARGSTSGFYRIGLSTYIRYKEREERVQPATLPGL